MANVKPEHLLYSKTLEEYFNKSPLKLIEQQLKKDIRTAQGKIKGKNSSLYQLSSVEEKVQLDVLFETILENLCAATTRKAFTELVKAYQNTLIEAYEAKGITFPIVINKKIITKDDIGKFLNEFIGIFPKSKTDAILSSIIEKRKSLIYSSESSIQAISAFTEGTKNIFELKKRFNNKLPSNIRLRKYDPLYLTNNSFIKDVILPNATATPNEYTSYYLGNLTYKANDILFATYCGEFSLYGSSFDLMYFSQDIQIPALMVQEKRFYNSTKEYTVEVAAIDSCKKALAHAHGDVLIYGLGIGYSAYEMAQLNTVNSITVIDPDPTIINFYNQYIHNQIPNNQKIKVVQADYFEHISEDVIRNYDTTFIDGSLIIHYSNSVSVENIYKHYLSLDIDEVKDNVFNAFEPSILTSYRTLYAATLANIEQVDDKLVNFNLSKDVLLAYFEKNKVKYLVDFDKAFENFNLKAIREICSLSKVEQ